MLIKNSVCNLSCFLTYKNPEGKSIYQFNKSSYQTPSLVTILKAFEHSFEHCEVPLCWANISCQFIRFSYFTHNSKWTFPVGYSMQDGTRWYFKSRQSSKQTSKNRVPNFTFKTSCKHQNDDMFAYGT